MKRTASVSMDIRRYCISGGVAWCMPKEAIKRGGADKTLPLAEILPAVVAFVCKLQQAVASEVRERAGCSGLSGFWLNDTNQMNQTDHTRSVLRK